MANCGQLTICAKCYFCQFCAVFESLFFNGGHTIRDYNTCQDGAICESLLSNGGHTIRDYNTCQTAAAIEGTIANGGHGFSVVRAGNYNFTNDISSCIVNFVIFVAIGVYQQSITQIVKFTSIASAVFIDVVSK